MKEIKNLTKAVKRIRKAIAKKERIILYGDADLDGITSTIILKEAVMNLGGKISAFYFPDREKEGYGITEKALSRLKKFAPALLVAMDLGITNFREIELANKMGFQVILIDHHQVIQKLPPARIIVNPWQKGDAYPFKGFAACGLSLRVAQELLSKDASPSLVQSLTELAALGTIADMMPREQDNEEIIAQGMETITKSWRPGLKAFFEQESVQRKESLSSQVGSVISASNVRDIEKGLPAAFRLFTAGSLQEARILARALIEKNEIRHERIRRIVQTVEELMVSQTNLLPIFAGDASFEYVLLGAAASILANNYKKPVFLYKKKRGECLGSARAPRGADTVKAMEHCGRLLMTFGGHAQASGFRLKTKNLKKFQQCLAEYFTHE